ncbi:MAG: reverse transcriptase family protein [Gammaproteobacteria bacterium]
MRDFVPVLSDCTTVSQLATALGVDRGVLQLLAGGEATTQYRVHKIPKRSKRRKGESRVVYEPATDELKLVHKILGRRIRLYATHAEASFPRACVFGYIPGRSTKHNAQEHCGAKLLLKADIKDFFPTISRARVDGLFRRLKIQPELSDLLSRVFCVSGALTPGLSASPLLANFACHDLDGRMLALAAEYGAKYTRYADDISISGDALPGKSQVAVILETEGFALSASKFRVLKRGQGQFVTGLSIADTARPHVPRRMKRQLRQELYYCRKHGIHEHLTRIKEQRPSQGINRLDGMVKYVSFIEKGTANDYRRAWDELLIRDDEGPTYHPRHDLPTRKHFVAVDEAILTTALGPALALACVLYSESQSIESAIDSTLGGYIADPFAAGKKGRIAKEGLHYAAAHPELRNKFIAAMPTLPFRCYIAVKRQRLSSEYRRVYLDLLQFNLIVLFTRSDRQDLTLRIEENPQVTEPEIRALVSEIYTGFEKRGEKRPLREPTVEIVSKKVGVVALPDFMLGVLSHYIEPAAAGAMLASDEHSVGKLQFERLRDRYSLIFDFDRTMAYSRRRPLQRDSFNAE